MWPDSDDDDDGDSDGDYRDGERERESFNFPDDCRLFQEKSHREEGDLLRGFGQERAILCDTH